MFWRLVFKEILKRKWGFLFSVLAVAIAIGIWMLIDSVTSGLSRQIQIVTTRMQQNIMIVPAGVPEDRYYLGDFGDQTLPEWIVDALLDANSVVLVDTRPDAKRPGPRVRIVDRGVAEQVAKSPDAKKIYQYRLPELADHYMAELQRRVSAEAGGRTMDVIMTGQRQEAGRKSKTPLTTPPPPGQANLGASVASRLKLQAGDTIRLAGLPAPPALPGQPAPTPVEFKVRKVEDPQSTQDDIRVYLALADVQKMLDLKGKVNRVVAISCLCEGLTVGQLADILELHVKQWSERTHELVPVRVTPMTRIAAARDSLRRVIEETAMMLAPVLALLCVALVGGYFYFNVRERQHEIAVFQAIGFTSGPIVAALVFKLALISLAGWAVGLVGGAAVTRWLGPAIRMPDILPSWNLWLQTLLAAVVLTLLAGVIPVVIAARTEAARILRNS